MSEATSSGRIRLTAHGLTDVGRQRRHNEDHVCVKPEVDLYVVADGMGGHNAGDVASALTTKSLENFFLATETAPIPGTPPEDEIQLAPEARRLVAGIRKANNDVFEISSTYQQHQGMGSTVVAIHFPRDQHLIHIAHVGDSRCYRIRGGVIEQLTRDHSLVNEALALKPDLTPDELARLPKNIITRALGMKGDIKVDIQTCETQQGDLYLLCSDGLSGMVDDEQLAEVLGFTDDLKEACELLIAMANDAGGADNITAVLIRCEPDAGEPDAPREASSPDLSFDAEPSSLPASYIPTSSFPPSSARSGLASVNPASINPASADPASADLASADLASADLASADLASADLASADPASADLSSSDPASVDPVSSRPASADLASSGPASVDPVSVDPVSSTRVSSAPVELAQLADVVPPEVAELLQSGAEVDIGDPKKRGATASRCRCCDHEVLEGNRFCVECGTLIHW